MSFVADVTKLAIEKLSAAKWKKLHLAGELSPAGYDKVVQEGVHDPEDYANRLDSSAKSRGEKMVSQKKIHSYFDDGITRSEFEGLPNNSVYDEIKDVQAKNKGYLSAKEKDLQDLDEINGVIPFFATASPSALVPVSYQAALLI